MWPFDWFRARKRERWRRRLQLHGNLLVHYGWPRGYLHSFAPWLRWRTKDLGTADALEYVVLIDAWNCMVRLLYFRGAGKNLEMLVLEEPDLFELVLELVSVAESEQIQQANAWVVNDEEVSLDLPAFLDRLREHTRRLGVPPPS